MKQILEISIEYFMQLANATEEISDTSRHQDIRLFKAKEHLSTTPLTEFTRTNLRERWLLPKAGKRITSFIQIGSLCTLLLKIVLFKLLFQINCYLTFVFHLNWYLTCINVSLLLLCVLILSYIIYCCLNSIFSVTQLQPYIVF